MLRLLFILPFLFVIQLVTAQQQPLFRITQKGKIGYINSKGAMVIPPIYHNAFDFAEQLAAVRENGLYGFIDSSGKYVIAPQFDYATYFVNGITLVYKERESYFIAKLYGRKLLKTKRISDHLISTVLTIVCTWLILSLKTATGNPHQPVTEK